jgi:putative transposase
MTNIRRYKEDRTVYFLTHIVDGRQPILIEQIDLLKQAWNGLLGSDGFTMIAWVALPDHVHMVVDTMGGDISLLTRRWKLRFSSRYRARMCLRSGRVWQYRFWDHVIRDESDLSHHIDYVHFNPVRHNYVDRAVDWEHSSFERYLNAGLYGDDWGVRERPSFDGRYGE